MRTMDKSYDNNYEKEMMNHSFHNSKNDINNLKENKNQEGDKEKSYEENANRENRKEHYLSRINEERNIKTKYISNLNSTDNNKNNHIPLNENRYKLKQSNINENINFSASDLQIYSYENYGNMNDKKIVDNNSLNTYEFENKSSDIINNLNINKENVLKENYNTKFNQSLDNQNNNKDENDHLKLNNYNVTRYDVNKNNISNNIDIHMQNYDTNSYKQYEYNLGEKNLNNSYNVSVKCVGKDINNENSSLNDVINKYLMNIDNKEDKFENNFSYATYCGNNNNNNFMNISNLNNNMNEKYERSKNNVSNLIENENNINSNLNDANNVNNLNEWNNLNNDFSNCTKENNLIFTNDINVNEEKENNLHFSSNIENTNSYMDYINMLNSSGQNYENNYSLLNNNFNKEMALSQNADFVLYNNMHNETCNKEKKNFMDNNFLNIKNHNSVQLNINENYNEMKENINNPNETPHEDTKKYFYEKQNKMYKNNYESTMNEQNYYMKKDDFCLNKTSKKKEENIWGIYENENKYDDKRCYKSDNRKNNKYDDRKYNNHDDKKYSKHGDKKYSKHDDKKYSKHDDKKYSKYDDKKYNKCDDKKYCNQDDKKYNNFDDKKYSKFDDKKYSKFDDKKYSKFDDKKYSKFDDKKDYKYDEKENKKQNKKYECNIFDDDCYFVKCKIYGKEKIIVPDPLNNIEDLNAICDDVLYKNICLKGYNKMTTVQKYSIPIIIKKMNLIASSQTGSGKTFSFLCPIISNLKKDEQILRPHFPGSYGCISPLCLVLCPTRELVIQIYNEVNSLTKNLYLVSMAFYGGETMKEQIAQINEKQADIIISTPGRLLDLLNNCKVSLSFIKYLVFDEADEMISLGFKNQIDEIIFQKDLCPNDARQTICFTATLSDKLKDVIQNFIATPYIYLNIKQKKEVKNSIKQIVKYVPMKSKLNELLRDISNLQGQAIIFVELRNSINYVFNFLKSRGFDVNYLHGRMNQVRRQMVFEKFREKSFQILIATSIAARGLDFPDLELVINYDLPSEFDQYMHRIGRTGRIGKNGIAINYFNSSNKKIIDKLIAHLKKYDQTVPNWLLNFNK